MVTRSASEGKIVLDTQANYTEEKQNRSILIGGPEVPLHGGAAASIVCDEEDHK